MADRDSNKPFLGTGWAFPPRFDREQDAGNGGAVMVSGEADVKESLRILIATRLGERVMLPRYGTRLDTFRNMTMTDRTNIKGEIEAAIVHFEPRVNLRSIDLDVPEEGLEGQLRIRIDYDIPAINTRANMVFPFYLTEGNLVRLRPDEPGSDGGS